MNKLVLLGAALFAAAPALAQPRLSAGLTTSYGDDFEARAGVALGAEVGLAWGRLLVGASPVELAYYPESFGYCLGTPDEPACGFANQTALTSTLRASYGLPVHRAVALEAGVGLRMRWLAQYGATPAGFEPQGGLKYVPHLLGSVVVGRAGRPRLFVRGEVLPTTDNGDYAVRGDERWGLDVLRASVGVRLPVGRR